jgi:hypothetical protein
MIDFMNLGDNISDEMLAAYIDGNATPEESIMIQNALGSDELLTEAIDIANDCVPFGIGDWGNSFGSSNMQELGLSSIADLGNTPLSEAEGLSLGGDDIYGDAFELGLAASDASELSEDNQQSNDDFGTTDNTDSWHNTEDICNMDNLTN